MEALGPEDSDDDFQYEEVEVLSEDEDDGTSEDLDAALRSLQAFTSKAHAITKPAAPPGPVPGAVTRRPEVMDDFLRNFFVKMGLGRTSEVFEAEWYELKALGKLDAASHVPDVYLRNQELEEELSAVRHQLSEAREVAAAASTTWDKFRKERDLHRMHHKRVAQEKNKLITDIKRLKDHFAKYEPTILELKRKYETAMKEKMMVSLERDKLTGKLDLLETQLRTATLTNGASGNYIGGPAGALTGMASPGATSKSAATGGNGAGIGTGPRGAAPTGASLPPTVAGAGQVVARKSGWATIAAAPPKHPYEELEFPPASVKSMTLQKTFKGHLLSVAAVALHPTKPILVTASDDKTWKMWHMPAGDLIMCGEGHKDWVAGVDFHPGGVALASGGGDAAVKIWDFAQQRCVLTFTDHKQAVWAVRYHHAGDVVASCSLDHTVRLWDIPAGKSRMALRGHVDSVNDVQWQPFSSALSTASSDKTVSVWDARSGLCAQTFYGHLNSCNAAVFNLLGNQLASTDADGCVKLWDTRMVAEVMSIQTGKHSANKCMFDRSGQVLAVACDDGKIKCFNTTNGEVLAELSGHDDAVQAVAFDHAGNYIVSCGSDHTFRLWS